MFNAIANNRTVSGALAVAFTMVALVAYGMVSSVFQVSRTLSLG